MSQKHPEWPPEDPTLKIFYCEDPECLGFEASHPARVTRSDVDDSLVFQCALKPALKQAPGGK